MALEGVRSEGRPADDAAVLAEGLAGVGGPSGVGAVGEAGDAAGSEVALGSEPLPAQAPSVRARSVDFGGLTLQDQLLARLADREGGGGAVGAGAMPLTGAAGPQLVASVLPAKSAGPADGAGGVTGGADPHAAEFRGLVDSISDPKLRKEVADALKKSDYAAASRALEKDETVTMDPRRDALQQQVDFLAKMQKAGITPSHPPTEAELKRYFATLKGAKDPQDALRALESYAKAFHVHEGHVAGRRDPSLAFGDIAYPGGSPSSWAEVTADRTVTDGRYRNDCQGFAMMAATLLGEAGFSAKYVLAKGPLDKATNSIEAHVMLEVKSGPPANQTWTISNQDYEESTADALAKLTPPLGGNPKLEYSAKPPKQT